MTNLYWQQYWDSTPIHRYLIGSGRSSGTEYLLCLCEFTYSFVMFFNKLASCPVLNINLHLSFYCGRPSLGFKQFMLFHIFFLFLDEKSPKTSKINNKKVWKQTKKYFNQLLSACSTQKLAQIHNNHNKC